MNIIHVFPIFSISKGGGTTWLICELAKQQVKDYNVTILTGSYNLDYNLVDEIKSYGVNILIYKSYFNKLGLYFMPGLIYDNTIFSSKNIFHLHLYRSIQNLIILIKASLFKSKCIIDAHGSIPKHNIKTLKKTLFDFFFKKLMVGKTKYFIAENKLSFNECISKGINPEKIKIINPPFPVDDFKNVTNLNVLRNEYGIKEKYIILYFGRFHYIKGIDFLIDSFFELSKRRKDIHLILMGKDDGFENTLNHQIKKLNLSNIITNVGFKKGVKKNSIVKESSICVQVSRYEQGAGVPFEAVLIGTPIIVSDHSGSAEDVKRLDAGYLTKFGDSKDLSEKLNSILENLEEAKKKTIKASKEIIKNQSFESTIKRYKILYENSVDD